MKYDILKQDIFKGEKTKGIFKQETLLKQETTKEILVGYSYKFNSDESIKSLFVDGEEYFVVSEIYEFCNTSIGSRVSYIQDELREQGLTVVLNKWELLQGGMDLGVSNKTLTTKRGITTIISLSDYPDEKRISFLDKEVINSDNKPEKPITAYIKYMVLPINVINFDNNYQRKVSMAKVREIAKKFDMRVVGSLIVSKREEGYFLVDGQHRVKAMELNNVKSVMCAVHENLTIPEEADLFVKCNNSRKQPTGLDNFRASILAGDKTNTRIYELCTEVGYRINLTNIETNKTGFYMLTVSGLMTVYRLYGEDILEKTLRVFYSAGVQKPSTTEIHGLALFLSKYQDIGMNFGDLAEKLSKISQTEILGKARTTTEALGGHTSTNYARIVLGIYNSKKTNRLEDRLSNLK